LGLAVVLPAQGIAAEHGMKKEQGKSGTSTMQQSKARQQAMANLSVDRLTGMTVINQVDEEIGEVEQVVRGKADERIRAVVSVGGFLGIGDKEVTIPIDELHIEGDRLRSPLASTEAELESRTAYDAAMYERLSGERTVEVAAGAESMSGSAGRTAMQDSDPVSKSVGFGTLDVNRDGYLSKEEADRSESISGAWDRADRNDDGRIDRSEFSAFEVRTPSERHMKSMDKDMQGAMGEAGQRSMGRDMQYSPEDAARQ
jgi:hypothetical protein